ncbi:decapping enzyme complex catalytic subunit [Rhodotorula paludigena]|uniref:decapping enzyme complex catalytic subunit n=1 Tax=Rhodotorula paludigena TaxID=86838 RepID=UPI00317B2FF9
MAYAPPAPDAAAPTSVFATLAATLDDLAARFIVNLPADELESMDRVCFQIEQAHWYYEDFARPTATNPSLLPSYSLKAFSLLMFKSCPLLHDLVPQHAQIWTSFMQYKERVPVCGAVLINEYWDKVLLVKGWTKGSSWSFPRGKINKQEPEAMCAVREVLEETGFDLTPYFPPAQLHPSYVEPEGTERVPYYVELVIREQKIRLYFVPGVSEHTRFETRTRKEISKIDWFSLSDLPTWSKEATNGSGGAGGKKGKGSTRVKTELASGKQAKFYMVTPFISHLKLWIDRNKPRNLPPRPAGSSSRARRPPSPDASPLLFGGRVLQPWNGTDGDATSHLPSETEHADGEESTEDESTFEDEREHAFQTTQQGTDALQALFFGGDIPIDASSLPPAPPPDPAIVQHSFAPQRPLPVPTQQYAAHAPSSSSTATVNATPPHVAYERQQSFLQPKPKPSNQQTKLLELLGGGAAGTHTPPPLQQPQQGQQHLLVNRLENLSLETPSPLPLPSAGGYSTGSYASPAYPAAHANGSYPSTSTSSYGSPAPPPHAPFSAPSAAVGAPAPASYASLDDSEKREKRDALLRALLDVAAKSPPLRPVGAAGAGADGTGDVPPLLPLPLEEERQVQGAWGAPGAVQGPPMGKGSLLSILNGGGAGKADEPTRAQQQQQQQQQEGRDALEILREHRMRQQQHESPVVPAAVPPPPPQQQLPPPAQPAFSSPLPPAAPQLQMHHPQPVSTRPPAFASSPVSAPQLPPQPPFQPPFGAPPSSYYHPGVPPQPTFSAAPTSSFPPAPPHPPAAFSRAPAAAAPTMPHSYHPPAPHFAAPAMPPHPPYPLAHLQQPQPQSHPAFSSPPAPAPPVAPLSYPAPPPPHSIPFVAPVPAPLPLPPMQLQQQLSPLVPHAQAPPQQQQGRQNAGALLGLLNGKG